MKQNIKRNYNRKNKVIMRAFLCALLAMCMAQSIVHASNAKTEDLIRNYVMYEGEEFTDSPMHGKKDGLYVNDFSNLTVSDNKVVKINGYKGDGTTSSFKIIAVKPGKSVVKVDCTEGHSHIFNITVKKRNTIATLEKGTDDTFMIKVKNNQNVSFAQPRIEFNLKNKAGKTIRKGTIQPNVLPPKQTLYFGSSVSPQKASAIDLKKSSVKVTGGDGIRGVGSYYKDVTSHVKLISVNPLPQKGDLVLRPELTIQNNLDKKVKSMLAIRYYNEKNEIIGTDSLGLTLNPGENKTELTPRDPVYGFDHLDMVLYGWLENNTAVTYVDIKDFLKGLAN